MADFLYARISCRVQNMTWLWWTSWSTSVGLPWLTGIPQHSVAQRYYIHLAHRYTTALCGSEVLNPPGSQVYHSTLWLRGTTPTLVHWYTTTLCGSEVLHPPGSQVYHNPLWLRGNTSTWLTGFPQPSVAHRYYTRLVYM